ncbi:MAG: glycosyltransferase family 4 protein [Candidatus Omnitrophota bacterium]|nr:glycosyltransferase family 4 protein [Candidatus Omnitrophota bacterium]MBU1894840.1 glycosyltransferase family 4 protein [Candidatus Omnitrophota bacterium]
MKILLLTTHLNIGGVGFYTVNLAKYLKKRNVDVIVVSSGGDLEEILVRERIPHIKIDIRTKFEFSFKILKVVPVLFNLVKKEHIQVIHAQTRVTQVLAWIVSRITRIPFISTCHGFFKSQRLSRKLFPCWGEKIIAISVSVKEHLLEDFFIPNKRVELIRNGIEVNRFVKIASETRSNLIKKMNWSRDVIIVGSVGRLSPVKGFNYLISAFKRAKADNDKLKLLIVGEGKQESVLKQQVESAGLSGEVLFVSGRESLEYYLSAMDIFCLSSVSEGLGLSLMEAMATGIACIASSVGGLVELINDGVDGLLVPAKNVEKLSATIIRLAGDDVFRTLLKKNAQKKAIENFSIEKSVEKTIKVYREMTKE